jgi:hypothetical protein
MASSATDKLFHEGGNHEKKRSLSLTWNKAFVASAFVQENKNFIERSTT